MKKKKSLFGLLLIVAMLGLAVGYAAVSRTLNVHLEATTGTDGNFKVYIQDVDFTHVPANSVLSLSDLSARFFPSLENDSNEIFTPQQGGAVRATITIPEGVFVDPGDAVEAIVRVRNFSDTELNALISEVNGETFNYTTNATVNLSSGIEYAYVEENGELSDNSETAQDYEIGLYDVTITPLPKGENDTQYYAKTISTKPGALAYPPRTAGSMTGVAADTGGYINYKLTIKLTKLPQQRVRGTLNLNFTADAV